jgi:hypothetical protein
MKILVLLLSVTLASCAGHRPMVDLTATPGKTMATYEADLLECQAYAKQISPERSALVGAGLGAVAGGLVGAVIFSAFGLEEDEGLAWGAGWGAASGATQGGVNAAQNQQTIINNCMRGRGYSVLN